LIQARRFLLTVLAVFAPVAACATQSQDLERARQHYHNLEFPRAMALLRLLGDDELSLSPAERVQYAFLRGMTDLRVSESLPLDNPDRRLYRACGRDWLMRALSPKGDELEPASRSLSDEQAARARAALSTLADVELEPGRCTAR
jgi:hypothetical protein